MGLESSIEKLDKYFDRLRQGKAKKIKPSHLEKIAQKLKTKEKSLLDELAETEKESKQERLKVKLSLIREQQDRAKWLEEQLKE